MIEIYLTVCLIAHPFKCRDVTREFEEIHLATPQMCQMNAQIEAVRFVEEHPNYLVQRMGCRRARIASKA